MHGGRPDFSQAGYTQASASGGKGALPNVMPVQLSMTTISSSLQLSNAKSPILVTLLGIVTDVRLVQESNAFLGIAVTVLGITTTD
jgi:hypothetical protein